MINTREVYHEVCKYSLISCSCYSAGPRRTTRLSSEVNYRPCRPCNTGWTRIQGV